MNKNKNLYLNASSVSDAILVSYFKSRDEIYQETQNFTSNNNDIILINFNSDDNIDIDSSISDNDIDSSISDNDIDSSISDIYTDSSISDDDIDSIISDNDIDSSISDNDIGDNINIEKNHIIMDKLKKAVKTNSIEKCNIIEKNIINDHKLSYKNTNIVKQSINVNRGIFNENKIINNFEKNQNISIETSDKIYYLNFKFGEINLKIGGRLDGIDKVNNKIIETKLRRYKFLGIREYEKVQLELYMKMLNFTNAILIERFDNEDKIHNYKHDPILYDKIMNGLDNYVKYIDERYLK